MAAASAETGFGEVMQAYNEESNHAKWTMNCVGERILREQLVDFLLVIQ